MTASPEPAQPRTIVFLGADADYMYRFRLPLMQELRTRGYRILVVATLPKSFDPAAFTEAGIDYVEWPVRRGGFNPFADLLGLRIPWRTLRRERPQMVFAHGLKPVIYGMLVAWAARVPRRIAMIPGLGFAFIPGKELRRQVARLAGSLGYRLALSRAHLVILQNPDDRKALREARALPHHVPSALVNGSGVDLARFLPAPMPEGPVTFLMVGRLLYDKGVREFVEAAKLVKRELPGARVVLVGEGDPDNPAAVSPEQLARWAAEGIVEARGHVADPRREYTACHVFVLPSYREGTPRTNLEAMAMGRAIITTDVPGCRETVTDGVNGILVPPRDAKALAVAMLELGRDRERVRRMGEAGLQRCRERYELAAVARMTADFMEGVKDPAAGNANFASKVETGRPLG